MKNESKKAQAVKNEAAEKKAALKAEAKPEAQAASKPEAQAKPQAPEAVQALWKKAQAAKAAFEAGLLDEAVYKTAQAEAEAEADKAREAYKKAAAAAKGFGPGAGGRCKGQMSGLDAAIQVLLESSEALQVGKICEKALESGLWAPEGQTPTATLSAAIQRELKKGEKSRIVKTDKGLFVARKPEAAQA